MNEQELKLFFLNKEEDDNNKPIKLLLNFTTSIQDENIDNIFYIDEIKYKKNESFKEINLNKNKNKNNIF